MNDYQNLFSEVVLKATRSGGKGGQNVNKVSTRVELYFDVKNSLVLEESEKEILLRKLHGRISDAGVLRITSTEDRTQLGNKENVKEKFLQLIVKALTPVKKRKPTKPSKESKQNRLNEKKIISERKKLRGRVL